MRFDFSVLVSNPLINVGVVAWATAQLLKTFIHFLKHKEFKKERLAGAGGMPSSHSALVCSVLLMSYFEYGYNSPIFAMAVILAMIVMYDATGVRWAAGLHAKAINDIVDYLGDDMICVVGETSVRFFDAAGDILGNYPYGDSFVKDFDLGGNGFLTLSMNMYRAGNRYSLVTLDTDGKELASQYIGQEILDLSACGKYVAVLTMDGLTVYNRLLEEYAYTEEVGAATSVVMCEDGSVLLLGGGTGKIYIP